MQKIRLVLMRHGESTANAEGRFGGWLDVPLTAAGITQARAAGRELRERGLLLESAFTSMLGRARQTCRHVLDELQQDQAVRVRPMWRLNERRYGALEGLSRAEADRRFGAEQVQQWRRGHLQAPPPARSGDSPGESLRDLEVRVAPFWADVLQPALRAASGDVLVVSHGNTLRALRRLIEARAPDPALDVEIPTAVPIVYEFAAAGLDAAATASGARSECSG